MKSLLALSFAIALVALNGCGSNEQASQDAKQAPARPDPAQVVTPYGSLEEVTGYMVGINPYIQQIVGIQQQVDQAVGTTGKATGRNLSGVMEKARPQLLAVKQDFESVAVPAGLGDLRRDILQLIDLRLEAYDLTMKGWKAEQENNDLSLYDGAQAKLDEANRVIEGLNVDIQKINESIQQAAAAAQPPQVATP